MPRTPAGMKASCLLLGLLVTVPGIQSNPTTDIISLWLRQVGIQYVPPPPRQGTCRDCTTSTARFGFDVGPTQATGPCCTTTTTPTITTTTASTATTTTASTATTTTVSTATTTTVSTATTTTVSTATTTTVSTATTTTVAPTCKCGIEGTTRIVGGTATTNGKYPWLVAMNMGSTDGSNPGGCGATLVATNWVVTAAHCVVAGAGCGTAACTKDTMSVVLGEFDLSSSSDSFDTKRKNFKLAIDPIVHETYTSPKSNSNDIALLKLAESVDLATYTPACLAAVNADYEGKTGSVYGWGTINSCAASTEQIAREVDVLIVSDATCEAASSTTVTQSVNGVCETSSNSYTGLISDDMLCAGSAGKDSCQGDSGGPFTVKDSATSQHDLVGVVSWGAGCAADGLYGVYAEVGKLRTWIDTKIAANGGATYCATK